MQESSPSATCPTCKSPIPADAPGGLCPSCALVNAAKADHSSSAGPKSPPPSIEEIAPHFPELEVLELLGHGAMGAVYKARQPQLDRMVAIKILSHELAQEPTFVERFNREAKTLARLSHPNIVAIHDFGTAGPYCYLKMEHVDGVNLRQAMEAGGFKPSEALTLVQDLCTALQYAHEEGILHRDIKPENVLIDTKGRAKIADFGIAKMIGVARPMDVTLTLQGSILGTPHYMAPEQLETPGEVDQRADIYSLGVVLYEMLTGELPIGRFALPSEKGGIDARIDEIVLRTLAKERDARYQTAGEVGTQVASIAASPPTPPAPPSPSAGSESSMARFSVLSSILSGVSIPVVLIGMYLLGRAGSPLVSESMSTAFTILGIMLLLSGFSTALPGIILGSVALGDIRKSRGRKSGLGLAMFSVLVLPIAISARIAVMPVFSVYPQGEGPDTASTITIMLFHWVLPLVGYGFLIRHLRHWALGVEKKDGVVHFPRMGLIAWLIAPLVIIAPLVFSMSTRLEVTDESISDSGSMHFMNGTTSIGNMNVDWRDEEPNQSWTFEISENVVIKDVRLKVEGQAITLIVDPTTDPSGRRFEIELGTAGEKQKGPKVPGVMDGEGGFAVRNVHSGEAVEFLGLARTEQWDFKDLEASSRVLNAAGTYKIPVATHPTYPSLFLEVIVWEK